MSTGELNGSCGGAGHDINAVATVSTPKRLTARFRLPLGPVPRRMGGVYERFGRPVGTRVAVSFAAFLRNFYDFAALLNAQALRFSHAAGSGCHPRAGRFR